MPMIARSPVGVSWQKTTCSWSASPAEPLSLWDVAKTLVTVVTLLTLSRVLVEPGSGTSVLPVRSGMAGRGAGCFPYWLVTHSRDDLVTSSTVFAVFWYV